MPINPSYQNQPMFNNPYGGGAGYSAPSTPSGGGGWMQNALSAIPGLAGMANPLLGIGTSLATGLLGGLLGGDDKEKELLKMQQKEAARVRQQRKGEMGAGQSAYQRQAASLFPEMPMDSFVYKNPVLDNAITNALMYRLGNFFSDWGVPQDRRQGGQNLQQQFLGGMNFDNPYGAPPQQAPPQPDLTVTPRRPPEGWMGDFRGQRRPRRSRRGENGGRPAFAM